MAVETTKYFGSRYLARDLYGNISVTVLYTVLAFILIPDLKYIFASTLHILAKSGVLSGIMLSLSIAIALIVVGFFTGGICSLISYLVRKLGCLSGKFGYNLRYWRSKKTINCIYYYLFPNDGCLFNNPDKERRLGSKIDRILKHFARLDETGYIEVYRYYMFVAMTRQALFYTVSFGVYFLLMDQYIYTGVFTLLALLLWAEIGRRINDAVMTEYDYILSVLYSSKEHSYMMRRILDSSQHPDNTYRY